MILLYTSIRLAGTLAGIGGIVRAIGIARPGRTGPSSVLVTVLGAMLGATMASAGLRLSPLELRLWVAAALGSLLGIANVRPLGGDGERRDFVLAGVGRLLLLLLALPLWV